MVVLRENIVENEFKRALEEVLMRAFHHGSDKNFASDVKSEPLSIAIAYSGGIDSTALLHLAHRHLTKQTISLYAFHIHHGLNPEAENWLQHCENECQKLGISFDSRHVQVNLKSKEGIEADARLKRYRALGEMCRQNKVSLLLTAHHEDDQVETVILQLMRGAGVAGLSGMEMAGNAAELLNDHQIIIGRPLLCLSRQEIESWLLAVKADYIEDDSNADVKYTRNVIRHKLVPVLNEIFPGFQRRLTRTAHNAQFAQRLLEEMADKDFKVCQISGNSLNLDQIRDLTLDRIDNLIRYWLMQNGIRMPSFAWLMEAHKQLIDSREDAQVCLALDGCLIRRYRDIISIEKSRSLQINPKPQSFCWQGEKEIRLNDWVGTLCFDEAEQGIDKDWLKHQKLKIDVYRGSAKLKLSGRSTKKLKHLYQEAGIPSWRRAFLPLIYIGDELIYAGEIGFSSHYLKIGAKSVQIRWEKDS